LLCESNSAIQDQRDRDDAARKSTTLTTQGVHRFCRVLAASTKRIALAVMDRLAEKLGPGEPVASMFGSLLGRANMKRENPPPKAQTPSVSFPTEDKKLSGRCP
jgi:hypothetical protein